MTTPPLPPFDTREARNIAERHLGEGPPYVSLLYDTVCAVRQACAEIDSLRTALREAEKDKVIAAGECRVPLPEPGSDMARILIANRMLAARAEKAETAAEELRGELAEAKRIAQAERRIHEKDEGLWNEQHAHQHSVNTRLDKELSAVSAERDRLKEALDVIKPQLEWVAGVPQESVVDAPEVWGYVLNLCRGLLKHPHVVSTLSPDQG